MRSLSRKKHVHVNRTHHNHTHHNRTHHNHTHKTHEHHEHKPHLNVPSEPSFDEPSHDEESHSSDSYDSASKDEPSADFYVEVVPGFFTKDSEDYVTSANTDSCFEKRDATFQEMGVTGRGLRHPFFTTKSTGTQTRRLQVRSGDRQSDEYLSSSKRHHLHLYYAS